MCVLLNLECETERDLLVAQSCSYDIKRAHQRVHDSISVVGLVGPGVGRTLRRSGLWLSSASYLRGPAASRLVRTSYAHV